MSATKEKIFAKTLELVSRYGIRMMSMDNLASEMAASKKTIYQFYSNKDELIVDCVAYIIADLTAKVQQVIKSKDNPVLKICAIYAPCLKVLVQFPGAFFNDLRKYHPAANKLLLDFRQKLIYTNVLNLLTQAKKQGLLLSRINAAFVCEIHFFRILEIVDHLSLRAALTYDEILNNLIVYNLRGLLQADHIHLLDSYEMKE